MLIEDRFALADEAGLEPGMGRCSGGGSLIGFGFGDIGALNLIHDARDTALLR